MNQILTAPGLRLTSHKAFFGSAVALRWNLFLSSRLSLCPSSGIHVPSELRPLWTLARSWSVKDWLIKET